MSQVVDALLYSLEKDIPRLREDVNMFPVVFEERACKIFEFEESERVNERLMEMLIKTGAAARPDAASFHRMLVGSPFNSMSGSSGCGSRA
jgi:hypothetical protein